MLAPPAAVVEGDVCERSEGRKYGKVRPPLAAAAAAAAAKAMGSIIEGSGVEGVFVDAAAAVDDVFEREEDLWGWFDDDRRASSEILAVLPLVTSDEEDEGVFDRFDFECLLLGDAERQRDLVRTNCRQQTKATHILIYLMLVTVVAVVVH